MNIGIIIMRAGMEKINPPVTPVAKENQNGSYLPSMKNGISAIIVDAIVRRIGIIL